MSNEPIKTTKAEWVTAFIHIDGHKFSLDDYPFYVDIYDGDYDALLLKTGRQVAKSTTLSNFLIAEACGTPHWKSLFVAPSQEQTTKFSQTRVGKTIFYSPEIRQNWVSKELSSRVFQKMFTNGSELAFSFAADDPDRARGVSADRVAYDEVQDILYDAVIPVINECMANSDHAKETYTGTPKSVENTIEYLWSISSQTEWVIKCDACSKHQFLISEKCIGKHGPICLHCGAYLNVRGGFWADTHKYTENTIKRIKGFHISQFILPKNSPASQPNTVKDQELALKRWHRILEKFETYPPARFRNEVIGISDAIGTRLISKEELESFCHDYTVEEYPTSNLQMSAIRNVVCGIDWGGGGQQGNSRTVMWIFGLVHGDREHAFKLKTLYFKVYPDTNAISGGVVDHIVEKCVQYGVEIVVGDAGAGALPNANLRERLGTHRALQVQYRGVANASSGNQRPFFWNKIDRFIGDRTYLIDNFMMFLKRGGVMFPNVKQMTIPIMDVLNEYEEISKNGRKVWRHSPSTPDDCLHAMVFAWVASKIVSMDPTFTYDSK